MSNPRFPETINQGPGRPLASEAEDAYKADVLSKEEVGITSPRIHRDVNPDSVPELDESSGPYKMYYPEKEKYLKSKTAQETNLNWEPINRRKIGLGIYRNHSYRTVTKHLHDENAGTKLASVNVCATDTGRRYEGDEIP